MPPQKRRPKDYSHIFPTPQASKWEQVKKWTGDHWQELLAGGIALGAGGMIVNALMPDTHVVRTYKMGGKAELPPDLFCDEPPSQRHALERAAKGVIRRTVGTYVLNQSRYVESLCERFGAETWRRSGRASRWNYAYVRDTTHTSANIADSAHAHIHFACEATNALVDKAERLGELLRQPELDCDALMWAYSGYCAPHLLARLKGLWRVSPQWIKQTLRGWRKGLERRDDFPDALRRGGIPGRLLCLRQRIELDVAALAGIGDAPRVLAFAQNHAILHALFQDNEIYRSIFPANLAMAAGEVRAAIRARWNAVERGALVNSADPLSLETSGFGPRLMISPAGLEAALDLLLANAERGIAAQGLRGAASDRLRAFRNKLRALQNSSDAKAIVAGCTHVFPTGKFAKALASGVEAVLGGRRGSWRAVVAAVLGVAGATRALPNETLHDVLRALPTAITPPFASPRRRRSTMPIILTSPKYIMLRGNGAQLTQEIRDTGAFRLEMPRKPVTQEQAVQKGGDFLTDSLALKIGDEICPGTSPHAHRDTLREGVLGNPYMKAFLGLPLSAAEKARYALDHPVLFSRVKEGRPALAFKMPRHVKEAVQKGAIVQQIVLEPPENASKKVVACVVLKGPLTAFQHQARFGPTAPSVQRVAAAGIDLNAVGANAVVCGAIAADGSQVHIDISPQIRERIAQLDRFGARLKKYDTLISATCRKYARTRHTRVGQEIRLLQRSRAGVKRRVDFLAAEIAYLLVTTYRATTVGLENLSLSTRGIRGNLAKVVNWMAKRGDFIRNTAESWLRAGNQPGAVILVDPRGTSQTHYGCGGALARTGDWHTPTCQRCRQRVNAHINAAAHIAQRALQAQNTS